MVCILQDDNLLQLSKGARIRLEQELAGLWDAFELRRTKKLRFTVKLLVTGAKLVFL